MRAICSTPDCDREVHGHGLCRKHYQQWRSDPNTPAPKPRTVHKGTPSERFWKRVRKTAGCWIWEGRLARNGYGMYGVREQTHIAHRFAYAEVKGSIPEGFQLDHVCHNRACVNPEHLRPVTNKQNNENPAGLRSDNTSGYRSVTQDRVTRRWKAQAQHNGRMYRAGAYDTPEEAAEAARQLRLSFFTHNDADRRSA